MPLEITSPCEVPNLLLEGKAVMRIGTSMSCPTFKRIKFDAALLVSHITGIPAYSVAFSSAK